MSAAPLVEVHLLHLLRNAGKSSSSTPTATEPPCPIKDECFLLGCFEHAGGHEQARRERARAEASPLAAVLQHSREQKGGAVGGLEAQGPEPAPIRLEDEAAVLHRA